MMFVRLRVDDQHSFEVGREWHGTTSHFNEDWEKEGETGPEEHFVVLRFGRDAKDSESHGGAEILLSAYQAGLLADAMRATAEEIARDVLGDHGN